MKKYFYAAFSILLVCILNINAKTIAGYAAAGETLAAGFETELNARLEKVNTAALGAAPESGSRKEIPEAINNVYAIKKSCHSFRLGKHWLITAAHCMSDYIKEDGEIFYDVEYADASKRNFKASGPYKKDFIISFSARGTGPKARVYFLGGKVDKEHFFGTSKHSDLSLIYLETPPDGAGEEVLGFLNRPVSSFSLMSGDPYKNKSALTSMGGKRFYAYSLFHDSKKAEFTIHHRPLMDQTFFLGLDTSGNHKLDFATQSNAELLSVLLKGESEHGYSGSAVFYDNTVIGVLVKGITGHGLTDIMPFRDDVKAFMRAAFKAENSEREFEEIKFINELR